MYLDLRRNKNMTLYDMLNAKDNDDAIMEEVAEMIWDICKISPKHGNAVMDLIGDEAYIDVTKVISTIEARKEKEE